MLAKAQRKAVYARSTRRAVRVDKDGENQNLDTSGKKAKHRMYTHAYARMYMQNKWWARLLLGGHRLENQDIARQN